MDQKKKVSAQRIAIDYVVSFFILFTVGYILEFFLIENFRSKESLRLIKDVIKPSIFIWLASSYAGGLVSGRYVIDNKKAVIKMIILHLGVVLSLEFLIKSGYIFTRLGSWDYPKSKTLWHYSSLIFVVGFKGYLAWFFAKKYIQKDKNTIEA